MQLARLLQEVVLVFRKLEYYPMLKGAQYNIGQFNLDIRAVTEGLCSMFQRLKCHPDSASFKIV